MNGHTDGCGCLRCAQTGVPTRSPNRTLTVTEDVLRVSVKEVDPWPLTAYGLRSASYRNPRLLSPNIIFETVEGKTTVWERL